MSDKPLLLIAEDDPDDQLLLRGVIEVACPPEIRTYFVWDGVELIDFLKAHITRRPNLVVLDLNMPGKDGRTALREMKADPNLASIPVAVLTTSHSEADFRYCQSHGIVGFYQKPGSMKELKEIMGSLCTDYIS